MTESRQSDMLVTRRLILASRDLDALRCARARDAQHLYRVESCVWDAIRLLDPTVLALGWLSWLNTWPPTTGPTLRDASEVDVFVGDYLWELEGRVERLAAGQLHSLRDLIRPGARVIVSVGVR